MSLAQFLQAIRVRERSFQCPATGLAITLRAPSYNDEAASIAATEEEWKDRTVTPINYPAFTDARDRHLLARVAFYEGKPLGADAIGALPEDAFAFYADQLDQLRRDAGDELGAEQLEEIVAELKKKPERSADISSTFAPAKLRALLLYLVHGPPSS